MKLKIVSILFLVAIISCNNEKSKESISQDQKSENKTRIMLLGVWHFDNPGQDKYNTKVDDYFSERRQSEIEVVLNKLEEFKANKIFIEQKPSAQKIMDSLYNAYINDEFKLIDKKSGRNEIYQLGFKLGKRLNVKKIDCVDADGIWLGYYLDAIADSLNLDFYNEMEEDYGRKVALRDSIMSEKSILENLIYQNKWTSILENQDYYNRYAVRVKDDDQIVFQNQERLDTIDGQVYYLRSFDFENIGADLVAQWYKRNLIIYRQILELTEKQDKILVIFGQGHIRYLTQMIQDNPELEIVTPLEYLEK